MVRLKLAFRKFGWGLTRESSRWITQGGGTIQTAIRLANESSAQFVLNNLGKAQLFETRTQLHNFATSKFTDLPDGLYLEFGVWKGSTLRNFSAKSPTTNQKMYGFDSFEGLVNPWSYPGHGLDSFNLKGVVPKSVLEIPRTEIIVGRVEKTLPDFLQSKSQKIAFVHIDLDVYEPVAFVLSEIKSFLQPGTLIVFDELIGYPGWENHELRAIEENFQDISYEWLAFSDLQALMRIK